MKHILFVAALTMAAASMPAAPGLTQGAAQAAPTTPSCTVQVNEKKLAGAARNSFMQRCEREAKEACDKAATERKLNGAARTSFTDKCVRDSLGT